MLGLGSRLAFLHLGPNEGVTRRFEKKLSAGRGIIFDRRGTENMLALTLATKDVCVDPCVVVSNHCVPRVACELADILGLPTDRIAVAINVPSNRYSRIKRFVHPDTVDRIRELKLPGVFFEDTLARVYPHGSLMCHVLGFVNYEGQGSAGVELAMDSFLRGCPGLLESRLNARRQEVYMWRGRYIPALEGSDVHLTLDQNIQYVVERALDAAVREHKAKGAWAIVQKVRTGEILAMSSRPIYDLNEFRTSSSAQRMNRAIGYAYEPGSTLKVVTIAAALNEGVVETNTVIHCEFGEWRHGGKILHDFHPYGDLTVADGLKKSSNILTAKVALRLSRQRFHEYLCAFGLGRPTGVDLPGEQDGILRPCGKWSGISATRIAIGQGVAVTAMQMLNVVSAIANDGFLMRPYVVQEVRSQGGRILFRNQPRIVGRPISYETATTMRSLLQRVTEKGGTGRRACIPGYAVAGKTGTAQKPAAGGYSSSNYMASFVGFVPATDPEIAVIVVVDEPQPVHVGGVVAAPVFSLVAGETMRYLDAVSSADEVASL
jgi:cell division protein FtsI (penicillin-binding protein 3)